MSEVKKEIEKELEKITRKLEEKLKEGSKILSLAGFKKYSPKCEYFESPIKPTPKYDYLYFISCEERLSPLSGLFAGISKYKYDDSWNINFSNPVNYIVKVVNEIPYNKYLFPLLIEGEQNITQENGYLKVKKLDDFEKFIDKHGEKLIARYSAGDRIGSELGLPEWSKVDPEIGEKILKTADSLIKMEEEYRNVISEINGIERERRRKIRRIIRDINKKDIEYNLSKRLIEE